MSILSSAGCDRRIILQPCSSRFIRLLAVSLHAVAFLLLFLVDLNLLVLSGAAIMILYSLWQRIVAERTVAYGLSLQAGEPLLFQADRRAEWQTAELLESFVSGWLITLKIRTRTDKKPYSLVFAADSIDRQSFRRLAVYLKNFTRA